MLYRKMKKSNLSLSILGFGCMRLPVREDCTIDEPLATAMLRYAIDHGVNYVDTAYPYHQGQSEPFVGRALRDGYREKVNIATKLPSWLVTSREDMDRFLDEQLARLQTDRIDFYLVHGLNKPFWDNLSTLGVDEFLDDAIEDRRIGHAGFSFHDELPLFREIVDAYDWTFSQIQYNFVDEEYEAGRRGLLYAAKKGLDIMVMEPIRGGLLATEIPEIRAIWDRAQIQHEPAEWALRWVWNHQEITIVLSGMSTMEQVVKNIYWAEEGRPDSLTPEDLTLFYEVIEKYKARISIPCTGCGYCTPCDAGVDIPSCFKAYNLAKMYDSPEKAKTNYLLATGGSFGPPSHASLCEECGKCEELCPQKIQIRDRLKEVTEYFGQ